MLPLISNVLPTTPAVPANNAPANASLLLSATTDGSAASRQQLPGAVIATGAPAAYFPGTQPQRPAPLPGGDRAVRVAVPPPTGDYIEMQPAAPTPPASAARFSAPVTLGIPLTTQLAAQVIGQQPTSSAAVNDPFARQERPAAPTPGRSTSREAGIGNSSGANAYAIAALRSAVIDAQPEVEAAEAAAT